MELFIPNRLKKKVEEWRKNGYPCEYPTIVEILNFNLYEDEVGNNILRYLRKAQYEALEIYWYLRIIEKTPHIIDLYKKLYDDKIQMLKALGIHTSNDDIIKLLIDSNLDNLFEKIKNDVEFVKRNRLETVRESLTLDYPSYILALAMGSGKTVLIGSIIAMEFALALEYHSDFIENALVFAPGKTILGALKEISDIPFEKILPPRLYKQFIVNVKITYTQDNEKNIPINIKSKFNIIITNTEKIRIQKPTSKVIQYGIFNYKEKERYETEQEIANLRLQTIASLPNLGIFSDEAHHTYGQSLDKELKKVRKTVDYLAENTNVVVVVNTTGTPYYKKQTLKDVIYWYGLSQGIKDGILKEVKGSIFSYTDLEIKNFVDIILDDFFKNYNDVKIFDGAMAKIAIYFPQTNDIKRCKPIIEKKILDLGLNPSIIIEVHNKSSDKIKDMFNNRINDPNNPYRVYLLVNMGTEGWNCPSLFATALARKLKGSNNFVLQAASRCLRQIPNNIFKARIYLSNDNVKILDTQLKETYGETLQILDKTNQNIRKERLILKKIEIPPISIKKKIKRIKVDDSIKNNLHITIPKVLPKTADKVIFNLKEKEEYNKVLVEDSSEKIIISEDINDIYEISVDLSQIYRLDLLEIHNLLKKIYPDGDVPYSHITDLKQQIETQIKNYKITEEEIEVALAIIKKDGFNKEIENGKIIYTTEIIYHIEKENLILRYEDYKEKNKKELSFHYSPYKMDSNPEKDFFINIMEALNENVDDIEDIYFIGQLIDRNKTDFLFEYKDKNGIWRNYTPDFLIKKKNGKALIIEIKGEYFRDEFKETALKEIEGLNSEKIKYEILLTNKQDIGFENIQKIKNWIYNK